MKWSMPANHQHSRIDHLINLLFRFFSSSIFSASSPLFWQLINYMLAFVKHFECIVHLFNNASVEKQKKKRNDQLNIYFQRCCILFGLDYKIYKYKYMIERWAEWFCIISFAFASINKLIGKKHTFHGCSFSFVEPLPIAGWWKRLNYKFISFQTVSTQIHGAQLHLPSRRWTPLTNT